MAAPKLTAEQKAKVKSLMDDEGESRAAAVAWVLAMEPKPAPVGGERFLFMGQQEDPEFDTIEARGDVRIYDGSDK